MNTLPVELVVEVFSHLPDVEAVSRLAATSRHLHNIFLLRRVRIMMPHIIEKMGQETLDLAVHAQRCPVMFPGDHVADSSDEPALKRATAADVEYREIREAYVAWIAYRYVFRDNIPEFKLYSVCECPKHYDTLLSCCERKRAEVNRLLALVYKTEIRIKMSDRSFGEMNDGTDRVIVPFANLLYSTVQRIRNGKPDFEFTDKVSIRDKLRLCIHSGLYRVACMILNGDARWKHHNQLILNARVWEDVPGRGWTSRRTEKRYWFEPDERETVVRHDRLTWYFIELNARHRTRRANFC